jgi:hypothetical protein
MYAILFSLISGYQLVGYRLVVPLCVASVIGILNRLSEMYSESEAEKWAFSLVPFFVLCFLLAFWFVRKLARRCCGNGRHTDATQGASHTDDNTDDDDSDTKSLLGHQA